MDWPTIRAYAEDVELVTTLGINFWVIGSGVGVAVLKRIPATAKEPIFDLVLRAMGYAAYAVTIPFIVGAVFYASQLFHWSPVVMTELELLLVLGPWVVYVAWRRERSRKSKPPEK
jgi:Kef-type K+ transport system membrane component KefB